MLKPEIAQKRHTCKQVWLVSVRINGFEETYAAASSLEECPSTVEGLMLKPFSSSNKAICRPVVSGWLHNGSQIRLGGSWRFNSSVGAS